MRRISVPVESSAGNVQMLNGAQSAAPSSAAIFLHLLMIFVRSFVSVGKVMFFPGQWYRR